MTSAIQPELKVLQECASKVILEHGLTVAPHDLILGMSHSLLVADLKG